ncbi:MULTISPECIES: YihY/virulence factor BrkB family protein [unclassified Cognatiyoonia]|uniref:YihY/virulence factor BrkB family protein n=1 Tax=unclassified Cognatiyoonia TaxID=2635977 RepID=UPI002A14F9AF|nr:MULTISPECIES: YihY/virulence factor BrkB family protein [unclassified Cognatiyoonia]MDX8349487.1 YihY/virulence factor BrkB family protein [Cognatiyoonia sp. IB215446]MDX8352387.1 YihY/virulence factor BrkB family protein [Cognatiyoonia sp. IB215182]
MATLLHIWRVLAAVWTSAGEKHLGLIAAGVAFFGVFGIFPGIAAVIAIFGLVADPVIIAEQLVLMEDIIPPDAYQLLSSQITRLVSAPSEALGWATFVSITLALWSCRAGVSALIGGLNAIAGQRLRNGIWQTVVAFLLTIALVSLAIVALTVVVLLPIALAFIPVATSTAWVLEGVRWLIALGVLIVALSLLYRFGPARTGGRGRWVTIGAFVVVILWVAASAGLSYYLTNFASYNEVYGSIGAVIGLLLWLYVSAYLILLGAALNVEVHGYDCPPSDEDTSFLPEG